jgi:hypothetical protein
MHFQYGIYNTLFPALFMQFPSLKSLSPEVLTPPASPLCRPIPQPDKCLMLVVTSEIADGATGIVHSGVLEIESSRPCIFLDVVIKLTFTDQQQDSLKHEYSIYQHLTSKHVQGIPTPLGLFNGLGDGPSALLMTYSGIPIHNSTLSLATRSVFCTNLLLSFNKNNTDKSSLWS